MHTRRMRCSLAALVLVLACSSPAAPIADAASPDSGSRDRGDGGSRDRDGGRSPDDAGAVVTCPDGHVLSDLAAAAWYELADTKIEDDYPSPLPPGRPRAITEAWSGGATDTRRSRMYVWGGGHADYWGNEVYSIDLRAGTTTRVTDPSPPGDLDTCAEQYPDGTPAARHTYDAIAYVEHADVVFMFGGVVSCNPGGFTQDAWLLDPETFTWRRLHPSGPLPGTFPGIMAEYDPVTRLVFVHDTYGFFSYSLEEDTFTRHFDHSTDYHLSATIDPVRRKFVIVGHGQVETIDLETHEIATLGTSGARSVEDEPSPGVAYDPIADRVVAWAGGDSVSVLDLDTAEWTAVGAGGGPPPVVNPYDGTTTPAEPYGTFGRFGYLPEFGVFALVNSASQNAYAFRLTACE